MSIVAVVNVVDILHFVYSINVVSRPKALVFADVSESTRLISFLVKASQTSLYARVPFVLSALPPEHCIIGGYVPVRQQEFAKPTRYDMGIEPNLPS